MMKSVLPSVRKLAVVLTVILAGFLSTGSLHAQTGASITAFNFTLNPNYASTIDQANGTIVVPVYHSADITNLVATFTASVGATVKVGAAVQTTGVGAKDYSSGVTFVVTSGDLSVTKSYVVTVTKNAALTDKQLLTFSFDGIPGAVGVINQSTYNVEVTVPYSQDVTALVATFTSSPLSSVLVGVAVQVSGVDANDFTNTVVYSVKAENTSVRNYYVTVSRGAPSAEKQMLTFRFMALNPDVIGVINQTNHKIDLTVPFGTDVTALVASYLASPLTTVKIGSTVQESGVTANNFTSPVTYTVVAENLETQDYLVTVTVALASSAKDITAFSFAALSPAVTGVIVDQNITLTVPYGTPLTALVATFSNSAYSTVSISSAVQTSGTTPNNFTTDKVYTVTAQNGTTKNYIVHVAMVPALTGKSILTFSFPGLDPVVTGVIDEANKTIALTVPYVTNVTSLVPAFTSSPGSVVKVATVIQVSGVSVIDFTNPVAYTCESQEGSSEVYAVTVTKVPASTSNSILTFNFEEGFDPDIIGVIDQDAKTITLTIPFSTDLSAAKIATFTSSPLSKVYIGTTLQESGVTENFFSTTTDAIYKCVAEDLSFELYTVKVVRGPLATGNRLLSFNFETGFDPIITGVVSGNTVTLTIPFSADITSLVATFTSSPYSNLKIGTTPQVSGVTANDFTNPIEYTCTAEDGSYDFYTVTVNKAAVQTGKAITVFRFNGLTPNAVGVINETTHTIAVSVPFTTDVTALVATYTASPMAAVKVGTVVQKSGVTANNFTSPVVYTVTSESNVSQAYTVTVTKVPLSTARAITAFNFVGIAASPVVGVIDETAKTITVSVPYNTVLSTLAATFTSSPLSTVKIGTVVQVSGTTVNDFTAPVIYDVYAEDASLVAHYTVTVTIYEMPKNFLTFKFVSSIELDGDVVAFTANGTINDAVTPRVIQVNIPFSAAKTSLAATFTLTDNTTAYVGTVPQVTGVTLNDFTSTRSFTLAATDGSSLEYLVTVTNNPVDTQKQFLAFGFSGLTPVVNGTIDQTAKTISVIVPFGTDRTALVASYTTSSTLTRVKVNDSIQKSGVTANDFTDPVAYRCFDELGDSTEYMVTVTESAGSPAKDITYFAFQDLDPDVIGTISQTTNTIAAIVPNGTDRSTLRAYFTNSALSTVKVGAIVQASGLTPNDFRLPVVYQVVAQDGSTKNYTVSVGETPDTTRPVVTNAVQTVSNLTGQFVLVKSNEPTGKLYIIKNNVTQVTIADLEAAVTAGNGRTVYVTSANTLMAISTANLPEGTYYAYAIDAAGNKSNKGTNVMTVLDRLPPTVYVDAQTKVNSINSVVFVQSSEANSLVYIVLEGIPQLSKTDLDAAVTAKKGARALVMNANSDAPLSVYGLAPGNYHAYAVDLSVYNNRSEPSTNVVVITEASRLKSILAFSFNQLDPPVTGQIIGTDISLTVKVGTPVTSLVATFALSPLAKAFVGAIQQTSGVTPNNFTSPVVYRVVAEDGSFTDYTVSVWFNTGVETTELINSLKVFPNPVNDQLTIESSKPLTRINIVNGLGQTIEDVYNPGRNAVQINTGEWMKGIYFVRYYFDERFVGVRKIIKD